MPLSSFFIATQVTNVFTMSVKKLVETQSLLKFGLVYIAVDILVSLSKWVFHLSTTFVLGYSLSHLIYTRTEECGLKGMFSIMSFFRFVDFLSVKFLMCIPSRL